jgi:UDP-N-acetylglucosamine 2-epimerase (non-hydrolysing)
MAQRKILFVFGTRPEAIKLCPLILHSRRIRESYDVRVCVTAQHRTLLDQVLDVFGVAPDYDLDLMVPGQTLSQSTSRIVAGLEPVFERERPDLALVQGDTTTTLCGALAAFYAGVPVGHVEAGLRTWDLQHPFPEEMNRLLTSRLAALHFAPTQWAADNLLREGVDPLRVTVTGNPGIDAVFIVKRRLEQAEIPGCHLPGLDPQKKLIVVTAHRRESFGEGFERICRALATLAGRSDVQLVYPVHPNPNVREPVARLLAGRPNVLLIEPLSYVAFVDLMRRSYMLITDSGGVQEEGPSLGKPILVMRDTTERPEAVEAGTVRLVGADPKRIVEEATRLLDDPSAYAAMTRVHNPYGDGRASERIFAAIDSFYAKNSPA